MKKKILFGIVSLVLCLLAFTTVALAAEYTASTADEFKDNFASAADGDTIVIKGSISATLDFGKSITYVLDGDGIVWTAGAQNTATGKNVTIISKGKGNSFKPNASMWSNSYSLTVKDLSSTSWTISANDGCDLLFDMDVVDGRLFYGTFLKEITLKGDVNITNLYSANSSGDTNYFRCTTLNMYDGVSFYGNNTYKPLIEVTTLNMFGGEIVGNVCTGMWAHICAANLNMYGGSINGNYQIKPHGSYTNANDPQSVACVTSNNAKLYDGSITGNFVGMGHDNETIGTVAGVATRNTLQLYIKNGMIDKNILVTVGTFGEFTLDENGHYTCEIDPSNFLNITDNGDGTYTYTRQYNKYTLHEYNNSVLFKNHDGSIIDAYMIDKDGNVVASYSANTSVIIPQGKWSNVKGQCVEALVDTSKQGTYYPLHIADADDGSCITAIPCKLCGNAVVEGNEAHNLIESLTYASYTSYGTYSCECTNDGCTVSDFTNEQYLPMFTMLGFSVSQFSNVDGTVSMMQGFLMNKEVISLYESLNGIKLAIGLVATIEGNYENSPLKLEGEDVVATSDKVQMYNATSGPNDAIEIKICGLDPNNQNHMSAKIIYCGYISDGQSIKYIDNGSTYETAASRTYNEALELCK
ncbi:MAG: hypothetical protein IJ039_01995 [Clostridia bacterium]|nr:hypothetical protein [Clostridia bacterium]